MSTEIPYVKFSMETFTVKKSVGEKDSQIMVLGPFKVDYRGKSRQYLGFSELRFHSEQGVKLEVYVNENLAIIRARGVGWTSQFDFNSNEINAELVSMFQWARDLYQTKEEKEALQEELRRLRGRVQQSQMYGGKRSKRKQKKRSKY